MSVKGSKTYLSVCLYSQHHEDTYLDLKPLPPLKLVHTPESLPNELFGDVVMVTAFISSYRGLLMPEVDRPVYTGKQLPFKLAVCSLAVASQPRQS